MSQLAYTGRLALGVNLAMVILAAVAVGLRVAAKFVSKASWKAADYLIIASLCGSVAYTAVFIRGIYTSGGTLDRSQMTLPQLSNLFKYVFVMECIFTATITAIKFSILALVRTIFTTKTFRTVTNVLGGLCLTWFLVCFMVNIFQCRPLRAAWDIELVITGQATCIVYGNFVLGYELSNMLLDISIIVACLWVIRGMQLSRMKKIVIGGVFVVAGFICIVCVIRIVYLNNQQTKNPTGLSNGLNWSSVELAIAILCACFPCYGPFLPMEHTTKRLDRWYNSTRRSNNNTDQDSRRPVGKYQRYTEGLDSTENERLSTHCTAEDTAPSPSYPLTSINVRRTVEIL